MQIECMIAEKRDKMMTITQLSEMFERQTKRIEMLIDTHERNKKSIFYRGKLDDIQRAHDIEIATMAANRLRNAILKRL